MSKENGTIDLGLDDKVRRIQPRDVKNPEDYTVDDYRRIMDGDDWANNNVVDLEIE